MVTEQFMKDVHKELTEMKKIGIAVSNRALDKSLDATEMNELSDMSVSDCASLMIELYN